MKKQHHLLFLVIPLLAIAGVVRAWNMPEDPFSYDTPVVPVTIGAADQYKDGGLSVNAFIARDKAWLQDTVFVKGIIHGGTPTATRPSTIHDSATTSPSTVYFGDDILVTDTVETTVTSPAKDKGLTSGQLQGSGLRQLCANEDGFVFVCEE